MKSPVLHNVVVIIVLSILFPVAIQAELVLEKPPPIPSNISRDSRAGLNSRRDILNSQFNDLDKRIVVHNNRCGGVTRSKDPLFEECRSNFIQIRSDLTSYSTKVKAFGIAVKMAIKGSMVKKNIMTDLKETTSVSAVDQLESLQMHGLKADKFSKKGTIYNFKFEEASEEARKGFDDRGNRVKEGTLIFPKGLGKNPWKEPVVTNEDRKRSPEIVGYETRRHEARERRLKIKEELERLNNIPKEKRSQEWSVKIAKAKQDISDADNEEIFFNFKINVILKESKIQK